MYSAFRVQNFRCFEDLALTDLARINLIGGKNNTGKTSLLEAVMLHTGNEAIDQFFRKIETGNYWQSAFRNLNIDLPITLHGIFINSDQTQDLYETLQIEVASKKEHEEFLSDLTRMPHNLKDAPTPAIGRLVRLKFKFKEINWGVYVTRTQKQFMWDIIARYPAIFLSSSHNSIFEDDAERFGKLDESGQVTILLEALKILEPTLKRVFAPYDKEIQLSILHGDIGLEKSIPLFSMGEGLQRLASIILAISAVRNGVLLIDEIENGLHHSVLTEVWRAIYQAAVAFNVQIFATTHSDEMIQAAHDVFSQMEQYDFRYYLLGRHEGQVKVATLDQDNLAMAKSMNLEVR